ncbi:MAG: ATP-binding protein [Carboxylicivirga sp.]|nr:ATP-binding protein [Carboxylicivirga sp.]
MLKFNSIKHNLVLTVGLFVILTVLALSWVHYFSVRKSILSEVYDNQLIAILRAHQSDLQIIIEKAIETSHSLADDPAFVKWFGSQKPNPELKEIALQKLDFIHKELGYSTIFAVNRNTNEYWCEDFRLLDVVTKFDPDDTWFFEALESKKKISLNYDYNNILKQSMLFVNVIMGSPNNPIGVAGVGIDPTILIDHFEEHKTTENTQLWLIDNEGKILISKEENEININLKALFDDHVIDELTAGPKEQIIREIKFHDDTYELASINLGSAGYRVVMVIPQKDILSLINVIGYNTIWLTIIVSILVLFVSSLIARNISKPIIHLTQLSNQIAHSKLDVRVKDRLINRHDEIGQLAKEFDQMQKQLLIMINRLNISNSDLTSEKSQLKKINVELKKAIEKAGESEKLTKSFMANISHEIRTPMNSILGFAQILEEELHDNELLKYYAQTIVNNGNQLLAILNNIIEVAKMDAGVTKPLLTSFSAKQIIRDSIELFSYKLENNIDIINQSETIDNDIQLTSDRVLVQRVLNNLISNAIKYTPEGSVTISYSTSGNCLIFEVADTGLGIDTENQASVFKPFWQATNSSSINEGAGLGLAISKMAVEILGGEIWLDSEIDKGSTFYFSIPLSINE